MSSRGKFICEAQGDPISKISTVNWERRKLDPVYIIHFNLVVVLNTNWEKQTTVLLSSAPFT